MVLLLSYKRFSIYLKKLRKLYHISYSHSAGNSFAPQNFLWSYKLEGNVRRCCWLHTYINFTQKWHIFFKLYVKVFQYFFSTLLGNGGFVLQEVLHLTPHTPEKVPHNNPQASEDFWKYDLFKNVPSSQASPPSHLFSFACPISKTPTHVGIDVDAYA